MAIHEIKHSVWGSNLEKQISPVKKEKREENHNAITRLLLYLWNVYFGDSEKTKEINENSLVHRDFQHRCGLLKIIMTSKRQHPVFTALLDGHVASDFLADQVEFRFAPEELRSNNGKPVADVWFDGCGKRRGPLKYYDTYRAVLTFTNEEQMDLYLNVDGTHPPD